jgi:hypothetical protein
MHGDKFVFLFFTFTSPHLSGLPSHIINNLTILLVALSSVVIKASCYKPEGRGFEIR